MSRSSRSTTTGLRLADRSRSGGDARRRASPSSGEIVYVLNNGTPTISGFRSPAAGSTPLEGSTRTLSCRRRRPRADRLQPRRRDARRHRARHERDQRATRSTRRGYAEGPETIPSSGATPYGFDFAGRLGGRDRGVRRRGRQGRRLLVRARRAGAARAGQRLGRRHAQRGLLGGDDEGRPLRLRDELRRRHDLELRRRRRRELELLEPVAGSTAARRDGHPRRGAHRRRPLPLRDRRRRTARLRLDGRRRRRASSPSASSTASRRRSPGSRRARCASSSRAGSAGGARTGRPTASRPAST